MFLNFQCSLNIPYQDDVEKSNASTNVTSFVAMVTP